MVRTAEERHQMIADRKRRKNQDRARLWVRDSWEYFDVWEVPVDALLLNADNRRFRAERMWAEEQLGRSLDPENNPDDEKSVEALLLDSSLRIQGNTIVGSPTSDYEALKNDWLRRGQETPLWIRPEGTVRNGNRRLAMIKRQQREGGDQGLQWVDVVILDPEEIDEGALLEMEQREQLTENFKVRYNDIDYLLALREAALLRDVDWFDKQSIDEVAGELQTMVEKTKGEVERDLYAIKYMDLFLIDAGQEGQYHRLIRTLERFRDVGRTMIDVEESYPMEADRVLQVLFAAIRAGKPHQDIRTIRQLFKRDRDRFDSLAGEIEDAEEGWEPSEGLGPGSEAQAGQDDDDEEEGPGPDVPNYPRAGVASAIEIAIDGFEATDRDAFQILKEIENRLAILATEDLLANAVEEAEEDDLTAMLESVRRIVQWADNMRDFLDD